MPKEIRTRVFLLLSAVPALLVLGCGGGGRGGGSGGVGGGEGEGSGETGQPPFVPTVAFGAPSLTPTGGVDGRNLALGDVDRDGFADVVVANATLANVSLLRAQPGAGFANGTFVSAPALVGATVLADVTGDHILDLVFASSTSADAAVATGRGDGGFDSGVALSVPWPVGGFAVVDWNADGRADVVVSATNLPAVALLPAAGGGAFGSPIVVSTSFVVADFAVADFDGDRRPDLACVGRGASQLDVLRNDGAGGFLPPVSTATTPRGGLLACCELDRDGLPDLVALDGDLTAATVFRGIGSATFAGAGTFALAGVGIDAFAVGDLDGDGVPDLAATAGEALVAAFGDGAGGFGPAEVVRAEGAPVRAVELADLRGLGVLDVLYVIGGNQLAVLHNPRVAVSGLEVYGDGTADCRGRLGMWANGVPLVGRTDFGYAVTNAPPGALGMLLLGGPAQVAGYDPFGVGVRLHLELGFVFSRVIFSDPLGAAFVTDTLPADPGAAGLPIHVQAVWLGDRATTCAPGPAGLTSSRGLTVTIQP